MTTTEPEAGSVTACSFVPSVAVAVSVVSAVVVATPFEDTNVLIVAPPFGFPRGFVWDYSRSLFRIPRGFVWDSFRIHLGCIVGFL